MKGIVVLGTAGERAWQAAEIARRTGARGRAFSRLVRAHIRNQRITRMQLRCHLAMLRVGRLQRDAREIVGQFPRDFAALLFSRIGGGRAAQAPVRFDRYLSAAIRTPARTTRPLRLCNAKPPHYADNDV